MNYWLFKSEPAEYSLDDLRKDKTTLWNGIRNYQARNFLRNNVKEGDGVLFYHSSCKPTAVVGTALVTREAYADPSQFDPSSPYYDPKATTNESRWVAIDLSYASTLANPVTLEEIKTTRELSEMVLVKRGRLSIQPVTHREWEVILKLGE